LADQTANWHFALGHPAAEGHFLGNPIIPGAVLLREIVAAVSAASASPGSRIDIMWAKFHRPVRPGDTMAISWSMADRGEVKFSCSTTGSDQPALTGALRIAPL
jgi:3-hydroxyacyl-[acyl-carrier-protein] dehydratase